MAENYENHKFFHAVKKFRKLPINLEVYPEYASRDDCFAIVPHGFPIDPKITKSQLGGLPPVGHPRRCQFAYKRDPLIQCIYWATKDSITCRRPKHKLMNNYANLNTPRLMQVLREAAKTPPHMRLSLADDLAIARTTLFPLLELYEREVLDPESKVTPAKKILVANMVREAMAAVREMSLAAARVSTISERTFDADQLQYIFNRMREILEKHIPPEAFDAALIELQDIVVPPKVDSAKSGDTTQKALEIRNALKKMDEATGSASPF